MLSEVHDQTQVSHITGLQGKSIFQEFEPATIQHYLQPTFCFRCFSQVAWQPTVTLLNFTFTELNLANNRTLDNLLVVTCNKYKISCIKLYEHLQLLSPPQLYVIFNEAYITVKELAHLGARNNIKCNQPDKLQRILLY